MLRKPGYIETSPSTDGDDVVRDEDDIEMGIVAPANSVHDKSLFLIDEDESECTHVLLPLPGHRAIPDRHRQGSEDCCVNKNGKAKRSSLSFRKFIRTLSKVAPENSNVRKEHGEGGILCTKDEAREANNTLSDPVTKHRAVPIYCAVCLTKYEVSNRVCWSSNSECSHVFHEDCMLHWLVVKGRKCSKRKRFIKNPSEGALLDFHMTCPCCRQDFISRNDILGMEDDAAGES
jgi:hypothetical protein